MSRSSLKRDFDWTNERAISKLGKPFTPFWLPGRGVVTDLPEHVRTMDRKVLINIINYLHFSDRSLFAYVQENGNRSGFLLPVYPEPCLDGEIACRWQEPKALDEVEERIQNLIIDDGVKMIIVPVSVTSKSAKAFSSPLPEKSYVFSKRKEKRYSCSQISVEIRTGGQMLRGELTDFSPSAFRVNLDSKQASKKLHLLKSGKIVRVELTNFEKACFSGSCKLLRIESIAEERNVVLAPQLSSVQVFKKRTVRNPRAQLRPFPVVSFLHPILQTRLQREVSDISSSGFSVSENSRASLLFPGMLIHDLSVKYTGSSIVKNCSAKVVYRNEVGEDSHCGIAILDVKLGEYAKLNQLVENAIDPFAQVSGEIEPDDLWEFFFSTGFIYPKKYRSLQLEKQLFKENCGKLYQEDCDIAHHFLYQKNGHIYGHLSIARAYERTWIIHHHAGRVLDRRKSGFMVLRQVMHYFNDFSRVSSSGIEYAMCFFRPENRFPNLVFGGLARKLNEKQICSMDLFTYLPLTKFSIASEFKSDWKVGEATNSDRETLKRFYAQQSGGLLLDAMAITGTRRSNNSLESMYSKYGLLRKTKVFCLKRGKEVIAFLIADHSSRGMNFSELMNCIKVIVIREKELPWQVLHGAIAHVSREYNMKKVPIMCYPSSYLDIEGITSDKSYQAWVFRLPCVDVFMDYMRERFRLS